MSVHTYTQRYSDRVPRYRQKDHVQWADNDTTVKRRPSDFYNRYESSSSSFESDSETEKKAKQKKKSHRTRRRSSSFESDSEIKKKATQKKKIHRKSRYASSSSSQSSSTASSLSDTESEPSEEHWQRTKRHQRDRCSSGGYSTYSSVNSSYQHQQIKSKQASSTVHHDSRICLERRPPVSKMPAYTTTDYVYQSTGMPPKIKSIGEGSIYDCKATKQYQADQLPARVHNSYFDTPTGSEKNTFDAICNEKPPRSDTSYRTPSQRMSTSPRSLIDRQCSPNERLRDAKRSDIEAGQSSAYGQQVWSSNLDKKELRYSQPDIESVKCSPCSNEMKGLGFDYAKRHMHKDGEKLYRLPISGIVVKAPQLTREAIEYMQLREIDNTCLNHVVNPRSLIQPVRTLHKDTSLGRVLDEGSKERGLSADTNDVAPKPMNVKEHNENGTPFIEVQEDDPKAMESGNQTATSTHRPTDECDLTLDSDNGDLFLTELFDQEEDLIISVETSPVLPQQQPEPLADVNEDTYHDVPEGRTKCDLLIGGDVSLNTKHPYVDKSPVDTALEFNDRVADHPQRSIAVKELVDVNKCSLLDGTPLGMVYPPDGIYRRSSVRRGIACEDKSTQTSSQVKLDDVVTASRCDAATQTEPQEMPIPNDIGRANVFHSPQKKSGKGCLRRGYRGFDTKRKTPHGIDPADSAQKVPHLPGRSKGAHLFRSSARYCQKSVNNPNRKVDVPYLSSVASCEKRDGSSIWRNGGLSNGAHFQSRLWDTGVSGAMGTTEGVRMPEAAVTIEFETSRQRGPNLKRTPSGKVNATYNNAPHHPKPPATTSSRGEYTRTARCTNESGAVKMVDNQYPPPVSPSDSICGNQRQRLPRCFYMSPNRSPPRQPEVYPFLYRHNQWRQVKSHRPERGSHADLPTVIKHRVTRLPDACISYATFPAY